MRIIKLSTLLFFLCAVFAPKVLAQSRVGIKNHNLILNCDLGFGNPYTTAFSSVVTGLTNYYLLNDAFFENSFIYGIYPSNVDGLKVKTQNPMGVTARELFNNVQTGLKIGYQSYSPGFVNAGIYATGHYKIDQFKVGYNDENMQNHRAQRVLVGATALLSLGSMEQANRVIIEAGCRYSIGLNYKSPQDSDDLSLNDGFVSHFGVKVASRGMLQNLGVFADINHFNLWNNSNGNKLNNYTFGLTWTITPQQIDDRRY